MAAWLLSDAYLRVLTPPARRARGPQVLALEERHQGGPSSLYVQVEPKRWCRIISYPRYCGLQTTRKRLAWLPKRLRSRRAVAVVGWYFNLSALFF